MKKEQEDVIYSRVVLYLNKLGERQPNLSSRVMQETITKNLLAIVKEVLN